MREKKYKVAVLNYPLMDPRVKASEISGIFGLNEQSTSRWEVPLYVHIPFCSSICSFCVYSRQVVDEQDEAVKAYVESLIKEIMMYGKTPYVKSLTIGSVFIGGGTPSAIPARLLKEIISACRQYLSIKSDADFTVECNVTSASEEKIAMLREMGVKRVSAGVQTFNAHYRDMLGLKDSVDEIYWWLDLVKKYKFNVLSMDLMYGFPRQSEEEWLEDLKTGLSVGTDHLSIYELCVLSNSKLFNQYQNVLNEVLPDYEKGLRMHCAADEMLSTNGFEHHIIPEYNRPGKKAGFWELTYDGYGDNLSVGSSSYGFLNGVNYQNTHLLKEYTDSISQGLYPVHMASEKITRHKAMERSLVLSFRRRYAEKKVFESVYQTSISSEFGDVLDKLQSSGLVYEDGDFYRLTPEGEYVQGDVSVMFMKSTFDNVTALKKQFAIGRNINPELI